MTHHLRPSLPSVATELVRRCRHFIKGDFALLTEDLRSAVSLLPPRVARPGGFPLREDRYAPCLRTDATEAPPGHWLTRAAKLIRRGWIARASRCLAPVAPAPVNEETIAKLRALHPSGILPTLTPVMEAQLLEASASPLVITWPEVRRALLSFPKGSGAGPFGLTPDQLRSLALLRGSPLVDSLPSFLSSVLSLPESQRQWFFSASLAALAKSGGGVRPVACGETFRRLLAKCILSKHSKTLATTLCSWGQFGVGVQGGLEYVVHALRSLRSSLASVSSNEEPPELLGVTLDFRNAFNSVSREFMLRAIADLAPALLPYYLAAYGSHSRLYFKAGDIIIASAEGVQQGDPLGPVFFALVVAKFLKDAPPLVATALAKCHVLWFLDDGVFVGPPGDVSTIVEWIRSHGPTMGLMLNTDKSAVFFFNSDLDHCLPFLTTRTHISRLMHLGACVGDERHVDRAMSLRANDVMHHASLVACLSPIDPHAGLVILRQCGSFAATASFARLHGSNDAFEVVDSSCMESFEQLSTAMTRLSALQATLPVRKGGVGLRRIQDHAEAALLASTSSAARLSLSLVSRFPVITVPAPISAPEAPLQRVLSAAIDQSRADLLDSLLDATGRARLSSLHAPTTGMFLTSHPDLLPHALLPESEFRTAIKLRLGLPLSHTTNQCRQCFHASSDAMGVHSLTCMSGGFRTRAHNALRNCLFGLASVGLLHPTKEWPCFANTGQRLDLVFFLRGRQQLCDVALTHSLLPQHVPAAASSPGGAATAYESVKRRTYASSLSSTQDLIPMVFDFFGACGAAARPHIDLIANAFMARKGGSIHRAVALTQINKCIILHSARLALINE